MDEYRKEECMKKIALLLMTIMSVMCLCACKNDITQMGNDSRITAEDFSGSATLGLAESLEMQTDKSVWLYAYQNDFIYCLIAEKDNDFNNIYSIVKCNPKTGETEKLYDICYEKGEEYKLNAISSWFVTADEVILYCWLDTCSADSEENDTIFGRMTYDMEGNRKSFVPFEENESASLIRNYNVDKEGNVYVLAEPDIEVELSSDFELYMIKYNFEGKIVCTQQMNDYSDDIILCDDRIVMKRESELSIDLGYYDVESETYETLNFKDIYPVGESCNFVEMYNDEILIASRNYIYSYNCNNNELKVLIDYKEQYVDSGSVRYIKQIDDNEVIIVCESKGQYEILRFDSESRCDSSEKISVKVAAIGCSDADFVNTIYDFSRHNDSYVVDFIDYEQGADAYVNMLKDIVNGNEPDIYIVNNMDYRNLVAKGMLVDLKPYLEKDDAVNEDFFIDGYLDAMTEDGKQYVLTKSISIDALIGKADEVGNYKDGWKLDDIIDYYMTKKGAYLFSNASAFDIFKRLLAGNIDNFVDWEKGVCSFDGDEFKKLLGFCKVVSNVECPVLNGYEKYEAVQKGELLFLSDEINGIEDIQLGEAVLDNNAVYIGYPSDSDNGIYLRSRLSTFAISANSDKKEAAWAVIKELMTGNYSKYDYMASLNLEIPVVKKDFDKMERYMTATEKYTDDDGKLVNTFDGGLFDGIELSRPDKEHFDVLKDLISKSKYCNSDSNAVEIIEEDVYDYISGVKDLETSADVIQDKMSKYVNENL